MSQSALRRRLAWGLVACLAILHQDFWLWDDRSLVLGFLPMGLCYQAGISIGASLAWWLVVVWAWPQHVEAWAEEGVGEADPKGARGT